MKWISLVYVVGLVSCGVLDLIFPHAWVLWPMLFCSAAHFANLAISAKKEQVWRERALVELARASRLLKNVEVRDDALWSAVQDVERDVASILDPTRR